MEQELKIKVEDLEFELDDFQTGKKEKNREKENKEIYSKKKSKNKKIMSNKPIYVNANKNYLINKSRKEEKIEFSKINYSNKIINGNKKKNREHINNGFHLPKKKNIKKKYITQSTYNLSNIANNTYTNNFYDNK